MARRLFVLVLSGTFAACSTTADVTQTPSLPIAVSPTGLTAQTLAPGECGLFGWSAADAPDFVFFAAPGRALYRVSDSETKTLVPNGDFPALNYGPYQLKLGAGEPLIEGTRYKAARMTETLPDGFTRVRPLVILQTCQTPDPAGR